MVHIRRDVNKFIFNRNRTHYLKWPINAEWSVRFIFTYDARPEYKLTWVLKSHYQKVYIVLTKDEALEYIHKFCKTSEPKEFFSLSEFGKGYRRLVIDPSSGVDCFMENKFTKRYKGIK